MKSINEIMAEMQNLTGFLQFIDHTLETQQWFSNNGHQVETGVNKQQQQRSKRILCCCWVCVFVFRAGFERH